MEENLTLLIGLIYLLILLYLLYYGNPDTEVGTSESECHARTRYSIAEKIKKEFER